MTSPDARFVGDGPIGRHIVDATMIAATGGDRSALAAAFNRAVAECRTDDDVFWATWLFSSAAFDWHRRAHPDTRQAGTDGHPVQLMFAIVAGDGITTLDADQAPPLARAVGRWCTAACTGDVDTGRAVWMTVTDPDEYDHWLANVIGLAASMVHRSAQLISSRSSGGWL